MAETANNPLPAADEDQFQKETLWGHFMDWVRNELVWYAGSFSFHLLALSVLLLLPNFGGGQGQDDAPALVSNADEEVKTREFDYLKPLDPGQPEPTRPEKLNVDPFLQPRAQEAIYYNADKVFELKGGRPNGPLDAIGGGGASAFSPSPKSARADLGSGPGKDLGKGDGPGFGPGRGNLKAVLGSGITGPSERAVAAALVWLADHQDHDGHWSLQGYTRRCKPGDKTCTGTGEAPHDAGATAMGLLPFLAAGKTHMSPGPYQDHVRKGIQWLIDQQQPDGNLAEGEPYMMYSHGLATIALCEACGLTNDRRAGKAAQAAVRFILNAQNAADGGWRYNPKDPGDTSVLGWQLMALKSAQMAGLDVGGSAFSGTSKWLDSVAVHGGAEYCYQPGQAPVNTMTSVGLLCRQYLGAKHDNPMLLGGVAYLMKHLPDEDFSNVYYWYYATQVMHNMSRTNGPEWDAWNRKMRDLLVSTQVRNVDQCANGSWAPEKDAWGRRGGRVMQTSLSTLTLEVYYRYLPLFKADADEEDNL
jgi:hypothetical protein